MGTVQNPPPNRGIGRFLLDAVAEGVLNFVVFIFRFFWWGARWTLATVLMVAVMAGGGYYVFDRVLVGGEPVAVPNITGLDVSEAYHLLGERGLEVGKQAPMPSELPKNYVIAQRPGAGKVVRTGRKVYLTVSAGTEYLKAPGLLRKTLSEAMDIVRQSGFREGTRARIAHASARDTVIGQDPSPNQLISAGTEIHLLVSEGPASRSLLMPDLVGMSIPDVNKKLSEMGVTATPWRVDDKEATPDVVLAQKPAPGSLIQESDVVVYEVRPSSAISLPASKRKVNVRYTVPLDWLERGLQADIIDSRGNRQTVTYSVPENADTYNEVTQSVSFTDKLTVEFYVTTYGESGTQRVKTRSYEYAGDAEPVITDYEVNVEGETRGESQDRAVNPGQ